MLRIGEDLTATSGGDRSGYSTSTVYHVSVQLAGCANPKNSSVESRDSDDDANSV
jgi:hypothetical protein